MKWFARAETRFGHLAIPNLMRIVVAFNVLVFVLYKLNPQVFYLLRLDPAAVMQGEVWRLVTYIFIPQIGYPIVDWLFAALYLWWLWWIGDGLEDAMGSFRFNVFYFLGMIGTTIAAFFFGSNFSSIMLHQAVFFAFARFYPDLTILLFFVLPVKVKWLAWFDAAVLLYYFVTIPFWEYRIAVIVSLSNFLLFFGREIFQDAALRREVSGRRKKFEAESKAPEALHLCAVCGRTENDAPHLDFRVTSDGQEYCTEHLPKNPA